MLKITFLPIAFILSTCIQVYSQSTQFTYEKFNEIRDSSKNGILSVTDELNLEFDFFNNVDKDSELYIYSANRILSNLDSWRSNEIFSLNKITYGRYVASPVILVREILNEPAIKSSNYWTMRFELQEIFLLIYEKRFEECQKNLEAFLNRSAEDIEENIPYAEFFKYKDEFEHKKSDLGKMQRNAVRSFLSHYAEYKLLELAKNDEELWYKYFTIQPTDPNYLDAIHDRFIKKSLIVDEYVLQHKDMNYLVVVGAQIIEGYLKEGVK